MSWYARLVAVVAVIGVSASLGASPTHRLTAEGQVLSVLAVEVPAAMTDETGPLSAR